MHFQDEKEKLYLFQVYAPQQGHTMEEKREFMKMMEERVEVGRRENEIFVLMGDFNARVGRRRSEVERILGPYGEEVKNVEGEALIDCCMRKDMKIMNSFFQQRDSHRFTRYRWNNTTDKF